MAKRGRPSKLTEAVITELLERLAAGESLSRICRSGHMPTVQCVYQNMTRNRELSAKYAQARNLGLDVMADDLLDIADDGRNDVQVDGEGNAKVDHDNIQRSRLRVDARKWYLSKLAPKRYGDRLDVLHSGGISIYDRIRKAREGGA